MSLGLLALLLPGHGWNTAPSFLAALPVVALALIDSQPNRPWSSRWIDGLLLASSYALRPQMVLPASLIVLVSALQGVHWSTSDRFRRLAQSILGLVATGLFAAVFIAPYLVLQWRQFGTVSPFLSVGTIAPWIWNLAHPNPAVGLGAFVGVLSGLENLGMLAFCLLGASLFPKLRWPFVMLLIGGAAIAWNCANLDLAYAVRYTKPVFLVGTLLTLFMLLKAVRAQSDEGTSALPHFLPAIVVAAFLWPIGTLQNFSGVWQQWITSEGQTPYSIHDLVNANQRPSQLQALVPPGERILVFSGFPRYLDFRRNPLLLGDIPGAIRTLPVSSAEAFEQALRSLGVRWVIFSDPALDGSVRRESMTPHQHRYYQKGWLQAHADFLRLNQRYAQQVNGAKERAVFLYEIPSSP
jgi:hypothetical protein